MTTEIPHGELVAYFLRLGLMGFGGPAALDRWSARLVAERQWLGKDPPSRCCSSPG